MRPTDAEEAETRFAEAPNAAENGETVMYDPRRAARGAGQSN